MPPAPLPWEGWRHAQRGTVPSPARVGVALDGSGGRTWRPGTASRRVGAHHPEGTRWPCPECGAELGLYDHTEERVWRHLDSCQLMTSLHAQPPRVECPTHGIRQVRLPWAEARARFTRPTSDRGKR